MASQPLVVERVYNAPSSRVWQALTNEEDMRKWYFDVSGFKPEVGYEFEFTAGEPGQAPWRHLCKVLEVNPGKLLKHTWKYDGYSGESIVTWELFEENGKTRVKLTHEGLDTFPKDVPSFVVSNFEKGWNDILGITLKNYVNG